MKRRVALPVLGAAALLLTPGAPGLPDVPGDPTPPVVTPVVSGTLGDAGWYTSNVTVNWSVSDPESVILSTTGCDARTLTADTLGTRLSCMAESDGGETTVAKTFKVDKTAPAASATASRSPDANGWYNHELAVGFAGGDATSGLASCSPTLTYDGPDTSGTSLGGACRDNAGNVALAALPLRYDGTAPQAAPAARGPDSNGWYNHAVTVEFEGVDATSGVASCSEVTYAGPDDASVALTGTCIDRAGNASPSSVFTLRYDETQPQASANPARSADVNGWYNRALTVTFSGADAMSGIESCEAPKTYTAPDAAAASVSGACRDRAGNMAAPSYTFKYDATAPTTSSTPSRQPNSNGWYNAPLTVAFSGTDSASGISSCAASRAYAGPDDASAAITGTCVDNAGNVGSVSQPLLYDATPPQAAATPSRPANANGWFNAPLTVSFSGTDATSSVDSCDAPKGYSGPDAGSAGISGNCRDKAGNVGGVSFPLRYDATAPAVTATPARPVDTNGWYNHSLSVSFTATDPTSTVASCEGPKTYAGPDSASASVGGTCSDKAGNVGAVSLPFKFDATAPETAATPVRAPNGNGWYNAPITVAFSAADAVSAVEACDPPKSYSGPDTASTMVSGNCRDRAGNAGTAAFQVRYDATAPQVNAAPQRPANENGWYNAPLRVDLAATDAMSTVASCDAATVYAGPDSLSTSVGGTCRDKAGNAASAGFDLRYDATAPQVGATPDRPADVNGWYKAPLSVGFSGADTTSGLAACDSPATYVGPDSASVAVFGTCRDRAGNSAAGALALQYDATAPVATATRSRPPNGNGWYNAPVDVRFAATDAVSGIASCADPIRYAGPDALGASVGGTCTDVAGNGSLVSVAVNYDTAPPEAHASARAADGNGWYRAPLAVGFAGSDAVSGVDACTAPVTYDGPDTIGTSVDGSCRDRAGNESAETTFALRYDATAPQVTDALAARGPDREGWYQRPVAFAFQGTDPVSGIDACPAALYAGPDATAAAVTGTCIDKAGNRGEREFAVRYDATAPAVRAAVARPPDRNGWYRAPVVIGFAAEDAVSGVEACDPSTTYEGPDAEHAVVAGMCLDEAGNVALTSLQLQFDATPPQVTGVSPDRPADANAWYNRPLEVGFHGTDATSGVESCTQAGYSGPDAPAASLTGSCLDRAGNASSAASFALRYDATPPVLGEVSAKAESRAVNLSWQASPDTVAVEIRRAGRVVYRGRDARFRDTGLENRRAYRYTLTGYDEAGNDVSAEVTATPSAPLIAPAAGAKVSAPPRLVWKAVPGATYYNVQLWRRGRILSAWPRRASLQLRPTWAHEGRRHRLTPGRYRWFVWPGLGRPSEKRFGPPVGSSTFVVVR